MNLGLNPYKNYITQDWLLWDGVAQFNHSRFLYPPIAGSFFQLIAKFPYDAAKHIWNYLNFIFVIAGIFFWLKIFRFEKNIFIVLITGIFSFNFFPLYTLLERGQIDGLSFLLITFSAYFSLKKNNQPASGFFLALASIFKFYSLLLVPFYIVKKKYKTALSTVFTFTAIIVLMYVINGSQEVNDYVLNQVPRISQYGESGTDEMRPDSWILKNYFRISRYSISMVEGRTYLSESISFFSNASLVRLITQVEAAAGINMPASVISMFFLLCAFIFFYKKKKYHSDIELFMLTILFILLFSPFTWVMNLIWLIPLFFILVELVKRRGYRNLSFILMVIGLFIIFIPDYHRTYVSIVDNIIKHRYIAGEVLIITGMILLPRYKMIKTSASELSKSSSISK